jgi:predicted HAD superfamily Cof-like phosphohydrolase
MNHSDSLRALSDDLEDARRALQWVVDHSDRAHEYDRPYADVALAHLNAARAALLLLRLPQTLREQVREFHVAMDVPADAPAPTIISDDRVRLRAALIAEEFFETLGSMIRISPELHEAQDFVMRLIASEVVSVDLVELADGLADLDYVVEGTRLEMGIDGAPVAAEVHRANMAKLGGPIAPNGKRLKPPGWTPPDIEGVLRKQGWKGQ